MKYPVDNKDTFHIDMVERPTMETMITIERPLDDSSQQGPICHKTSTTPWHADIVNYLTCAIIPSKFSYQRKKKFFFYAKYYQ